MSEGTLKPWRELEEGEQLRLQEGFGRYLDANPAFMTCSFDSKMKRFQDWLGEQGISFTQKDLEASL